jgi:hypothetical protein
MNIRYYSKADRPRILDPERPLVHYNIETDTYWLLNEDASIGIELPSTIRLDALNKDHVMHKTGTAEKRPAQWQTTS